MNNIDSGNTAANIIFHPKDKKYRDENRKFQGIPSVEVTARGTLYTVFYTGMEGEMAGNYAYIMRRKKDDELESPYMIIESPLKQNRIFDCNLWIDPHGRLWFLWAQMSLERTLSEGYYDQRSGVWAAICQNPDDDEILVGEPFRIFDGIMMNKPTVLKNGTWLFPISIWNCYNAISEIKSEYEPAIYAIASDDDGNTFHIQGLTTFEKRTFDEHMFVELSGGKVWLLMRSDEVGIMQSFSEDSGKTWTIPEHYYYGGTSSRFFIRRLNGGELLFIYHMNQKFHSNKVDNTTLSKANRERLCAALSYDDGESWAEFLMMDEREGVSYPDAKQDDFGKIHVVYDYQRYKDREIYLSEFTVEDIKNDNPPKIEIISKATGEF